MKVVVLFALMNQFSLVDLAKAESASVTIRAACDQNPNMGAGNCPTGTRANPAPLCVDEPENSTDSRLNCQTLGEALLGDERSCLDSHRVPASARIAASDLNRFVESCEFRPHTPYQDIQDLTCVGQAQARDVQINNLYQDLASRSVAQINCRLDTINQYFTYRPPANNPAPKAAMIAAARAKFNQVKSRIRGLIYSKQVLLQRAQERSFQNTRYCTGLGCGAPVAAGEREQVQIQANYEGAIAAEISKIPFGYEPDVATAFFSMAQNGEFDENAFENALIATFNKYNGLRSYYDQRTIRSGDGIRYCIDSQFKGFAVSSGVVGQLLDAYPATIMSPTARDIVRCRLESKYATVGRRADAIMNGVFLVGAGAAAVLTAVPTGGGSLATYGAIASLGLTVGSFSYQVEQAHRACRTRNFLISSTGGEQCNAAEDFQKEVSQFSLSNCLAQTGLAALEAIPILPEVAALGRSSRVINSAEEITGAATDAASAEARAARSRPRPSEEAPRPQVARRETLDTSAAPQGRRPRDSRAPSASTASARPATGPVRDFFSRLNRRFFAPITAPQTVRTTRVIRDTEAGAADLARRGIGFRETNIETYLQSNVLHFNKTRMINETGQASNYGKVLEITTLPSPGRARGPGTNAFVHPEMQAYLDRLRAMGYRLVVDTSIPHTGAGAYQWSFTKVLALRPNSTWQTFLHEFQHVEFSEHLATNFSYMRARVGLGDRLEDVMRSTDFAALGPQRIARVETLMRRGLPELAVNETLSVDAELAALGFRRYIPFLGSGSEKYALRHQITELQKLGTRTAVQNQTLNQARVRYAGLLAAETGGMLAPAATAGAAKLIYDRIDNPDSDPNSYAQVVYDQNGHTLAQRSDGTWVSLNR